MTSDRALMWLIRKQDERAFTELVHRHEGRMRAVAARLLGSRPDAEDAVQRALLKALTAASSYRPAWAVSTWLYRILTNICVDEIRRRRVRQSLCAAGSEQASSGGRGTPDSTGTRLDVQRALRKVPTEARLLLVLHYVDGMSNGELAQVRGISINTVKSQLARGKGILKLALQEGRR